MIKKNITLAFLTLVTTLISCKDQREAFVYAYDDKNNIVGQTEAQFSNVAPEKYINPKDYAKIEFENAEFDFDTINQGDKVDHIFKFKNTGKADLNIADAKASCGCTVPEWTKTPIKSGESGELKIIFDSAGKSGEQNKTVTLTTNTMVVNEQIKFKVFIKTNNKK